MVKRIVIGIAALSLVLGLTGCASGPTSSSQPTAAKPVATPEAPKPTPAPPTGTPEPKPAEPVIFEGKGAKVTPEFKVSNGLLVFTMSHDGDGAFAVKVFDSKSEENPSRVIDNVEKFDGSVAWSVNDKGFMTMKSGSYKLGVEATGNWKVTVAQPQMTSGKAVPLELSGTGTTVTEAFNLTQGPRTFAYTAQTGEFMSNFIVKLVKVDGTKEEVVANELPTKSKPVEGSKIIGIKSNEAGLYVLSVRAAGPWRLSVE